MLFSFIYLVFLPAEAADWELPVLAMDPGEPSQRTGLASAISNARGSEVAASGIEVVGSSVLRSLGLDGWRWLCLRRACWR